MPVQPLYPFEIERDCAIARDGTGYELYGTVYARDAEHAAEVYGEESDVHSADYSIIGGEDDRIRITDPDGVVTEWRVSGETIPSYTASRVATRSQVFEPSAQKTSA